MIENLYLFVLFCTGVLSIALNIRFAEFWFRLVSFTMSVLTIIMISSGIWFLATGGGTDHLTTLFFCIVAASYLIPLILNIKRINFCYFFQGLVSIILLTPTYVNIFSIYAICNIHDVTWGSRPTVVSTEVKQANAKRDVDYKFYRSNILIFWVICNWSISSLLVFLDRRGFAEILFGISIVIAFVTIFKLICCFIHFNYALVKRTGVKKWRKKQNFTKYDFSDRLGKMDEPDSMVD